MLKLEGQHLALRLTWRRVAGRQVVNDIAYTLYVHALNAWIIELSDFGRVLQQRLEEIKQHHRRQFRRNRWKEIRANLSRISLVGDLAGRDANELRQELAVQAANQDRAEFKAIWDHYFPTSHSCGLPSHRDIDRLKARLARIGRPIRDHRNTVSAHPDAQVRLVADWRHISRVFTAARRVVRVLFYLNTRGGLLFETPETDRQARQIAGVLADAICGSERPPNIGLQPTAASAILSRRG
jgi:hypothetical protein